MLETPLHVAGEHLLLLADKALYWPARRVLCVADVHFGKAAAYRALGQPVPQGTTSGNLRRLDALLAAKPIDHLMFLGDFFHAPRSQAPATLAALAAWRAQHPRLCCTLIRGNHDLRAGDPPAHLAIAVVEEPFRLGPFAFRHTPDPEPGLHVVAGHIHPVFSLHGRGRQRLRLPCFVSTPAVTVLPSFGDFTGGYEMALAPEARVFVSEGGGVWPVPR